MLLPSKDSLAAEAVAASVTGSMPENLQPFQKWLFYEHTQKPRKLAVTPNLSPPGAWARLQRAAVSCRAGGADDAREREQDAGGDRHA